MKVENYEEDFEREEKKRKEEESLKHIKEEEYE